MSCDYDELTLVEQGEKVAACQSWQHRAFGDPDRLAHHLHLDLMVAEHEPRISPYGEAMAG